MVKVCVIDKENRFMVCSMSKASKILGISRNNISKMRKMGISKRTYGDNTLLLFNNDA